MAVDTRNKRFSLISFAQPIMWIAPDPDGDITSVFDRAQLEYLYAGITLDGGSAPVSHTGELMLMWHRRRR